jgi:hypothetical protein
MLLFPDVGSPTARPAATAGLFLLVLRLLLLLVLRLLLLLVRRSFTLSSVLSPAHRKPIRCFHCIASFFKPRKTAAPYFFTTNADTAADTADTE